MGIRILFLVPYPVKKSPSQRFRFEQYFPLLKNNGFEFAVSSFLEEADHQLFAAAGNDLKKFQALFTGFMKRFRDMLRARSYSFVFIHREASPIGPPIFEWILRFIMRKKIIYDFDDAIWLTDKLNESVIEKNFKARGKVKRICRWAFRVSCSNEYLYNYASRFNKKIVRLPTTVDTETIHNPDLHRAESPDSRVTIGWTGSYSTLKYLNALEDVIRTIQLQNPDVSFLVIADQPPSLEVPSLRFVPWNPESEIEDLLKIDIGVMPLPDDEWTRGKGGFKCIQYMALEIPVVASDVGVNSQIITHGVNGFLARHSEEWKQYLLMLINDRQLRERMGRDGRKKIKKSYSVLANSDVFLSLFL